MYLLNVFKLETKLTFSYEYEYSIFAAEIFRKALNDQKEMKLLLDMYKGVSKDQRDKVQLMATEKKLRSEIEELRNQMKKIQVQFDYFQFDGSSNSSYNINRLLISSKKQESKREERKKLADEDALRKIKQLEEQKYELQKQVANQKPADGSWSGHYGTRPFVGSPVGLNRVCTSRFVYSARTN